MLLYAIRINGRFEFGNYDFKVADKVILAEEYVLYSHLKAERITRRRGK